MNLKQIISNFNTEAPCKIFSINEQWDSEIDERLYVPVKEYKSVKDIELEYLNSTVVKATCIYSQIIFFIDSTDYRNDIDDDKKDEPVSIPNITESCSIYFHKGISVIPIDPKPITVQNFFKSFSSDRSQYLFAHDYLGDIINTCTRQTFKELPDDIQNSIITNIYPHKLIHLWINIQPYAEKTAKHISIDELLLLAPSIKIHEVNPLTLNANHIITEIFYNEWQHHFIVKTAPYEYNQPTD